MLPRAVLTVSKSAVRRHRRFDYSTSPLSDDLSSVSKKLGLQSLTDWYRVPLRLLRKAPDYQLALKTSGKSSLEEALQAAFPSHTWDPSLFEQRFQEPGSVEEHRLCFDFLGKQLGFASLADWYTIERHHFRRSQAPPWAREIISHYGSLAETLIALYPDHSWHIWRFGATPPGFWSNIANRKAFFDWAGEQLGITSMNDWYAVSAKKIEDLGGETIMQYHYRYSLPAALQELYPEHKWVSWYFGRLPTGFWDDVSVQRSYMEWLLTQHFGTSSDNLNALYGLTHELLVSQRGSYLIRLYGDIYSMLQTIYPDHAWEQWRFNARYVWDPEAIQRNPEQLKVFVQHLSSVLSIPENDLDGWYRVSILQLTAIGAISVVRRLGGLAAVLQKIFPDHQWDASKFALSFKRSQQQFLRTVLEELFPGSEVVEGYKLAVGKQIKGAGDTPEIDLYLPAQKLGFEYQGEQHFWDVRKVSQVDIGRTADSAKRAMCFREGITLIDVPYWWDNSRISLHNSIRQVRPDLLPNEAGDGRVISETPPESDGHTKGARRGRKPRNKKSADGEIS